MYVYTSNLKNRDFDKEGPQNFCSERTTIAERQGVSENENYEVNPTTSKTDSSSCLGIKQNENDATFTERSFFAKVDGRWFYVKGDIFSGKHREIKA